MDSHYKYKVIDFTNWEELDLPVSGVREKKWLRNADTGEIGLFKYPKTDYSGDYWAEKIAYELGNFTDIRVARTELGSYDGRIGSFSYYILEDGEYLLEGYSIIGDVLDFSTSSEIYEKIGLNYSVELLEDVLKEHFHVFLNILVFDCLIGNTDRHHGNWAFITDDNGAWLKLSPLYDNGSSLCYLERPKRIALMKKDKMMLESALFTKPKSQIGIGDVRPANHFDVFAGVCAKYKNEMMPIMASIRIGITDESLSELIGKFDDRIIGVEMKQFVKLFLVERRNKMMEIFDMHIGGMGV